MFSDPGAGEETPEPCRAPQGAPGEQLRDHEPDKQSSSREAPQPVSEASVNRES